MTKAQFIETLRRRLAGVPQAEVDELIGDYASHFAQGVAAGRSEDEIAEALGDPVRLARELRAELGFRRWEEAPTPSNFFAVLLAFLALAAIDFVFLLPLLGGLALFALITGIVMLALSAVGVVLLLTIFQWDHGTFLNHLARIFGGFGLLGLGMGGGALLLLLVGYAVRLLGKFARLHYTLLAKAGHAA